MQGMKCAILENLPIITNMESTCLRIFGKLVTKSIVISSQIELEIGKGVYVLSLAFLSLTHNTPFVTPQV